MKAYKVNITKSRAGHYRLTLISKENNYFRVTGLPWSTPQQARVMEEESLAKRLEDDLTAYRAKFATA